MTLWQEPSRQFPYLTLPSGSSKSPVLPEHLVRVGGQLAVPVSDSFLEAWEGPIEESPAAITKALRPLVACFNTFILAGQGLVQVSTKDSPRDFVTEMDVGLEMIIRIWLNRHFPTHKIIGEEGFKDQLTAEDTVWYVDPIDGTSNFIESHQNITFQLGSTKQGKPYVAIMGLPFEGRVISGHCDVPGIEGLDVRPLDGQFPLTIGAEFREHKREESVFFDRITQELAAQKLRVKSIGVNLLACVEGRSWAFYKPDLKLWDGIPPLCLLMFACPGVFDIGFYIPQHKGRVTLENSQKVSIFGNDEVMISRLNKKHALDCRIGTLIVTPNARPDIQDFLTQACLKTGVGGDPE